MGPPAPKQTPQASTDDATKIAKTRFITHLTDIVPEKRPYVNARSQVMMQKKERL